MDYEYLQQIFAALTPLGLSVVVHGLGMEAVRRCFNKFGIRLLSGRHRIGRPIFMIAIVTIMLLTHFAEVVVWAVFFLQVDMIQSVQSAMLFSIQSYTTIGPTRDLTGTWEGFGGFEAMTGMLMFGWSTAILATVLVKIHSIDE